MSLLMLSMLLRMAECSRVLAVVWCEGKKEIGFGPQKRVKTRLPE